MMYTHIHDIRLDSTLARLLDSRLQITVRIVQVTNKIHVPGMS